MKRARGKNTKKAYEQIDVPEMIKKKPVPKKKSVSKKKKKMQQRKRAVLYSVFTLLLIFLIAMGMGWGQGGEDEGALVPVDMDKGKLNCLVLGVDKDGLRTDAIMLVSYDLKNPSANILSIPRDTKIKVADRKVTRKINEIHAMHNSKNDILGPMGSVEAVQALTGIPIHYYIEFSFDAIDEITDVLGPIKFDVPDVEGNGRGMNYDDPAQDLHIHLKPGMQKLKGNQVQQFLRYRKSNSGVGTGSDTDRVERQKEFIKAIVEQKVNVGLIAKMPGIYSKLKKNIKTNFSPSDVIKYAKYLNGLNAEGINTISIPGEAKLSSAWYFECDLSETKELIEGTFGYNADNLTNVISVNDITGSKKVLSSTKEDKKTEDEENKQNEEIVDEIEENEEENVETPNNIVIDDNEPMEEIFPEDEESIDDAISDYIENSEDEQLENEQTEDVITLN